MSRLEYSLIIYTGTQLAACSKYLFELETKQKHRQDLVFGTFLSERNIKGAWDVIRQN